MTDNKNVPHMMGEKMSTMATTFDRRTLVRRGTALGFGVTAAGAIARAGVAALGATTTPAAEGSGEIHTIKAVRTRLTAGQRLSTLIDSCVRSLTSTPGSLPLSALPMKRRMTSTWSSRTRAKQAS